MIKTTRAVRLGLFILICLGQGLLFSASTCYARERDEIGGLVIDRTITRFGKQFYRDFCTLWREADGTQDYNVVIVESPIPQSGTRVFVEINQARVFQTYFGRREGADTQGLAASAVMSSTEFMATRMSVESSPDLYGNGY